MTQQEQERQAIEEAAFEFSQKPAFVKKGIEIETGAGFIAGAEFALSELRKPNEDICPKCGYPIRLQGNGIMERICTCNHAKPSEDLIKEILIILDEHSDTDESGASFLLGGEYEEIASEIAKLLASFRSQQNDVNVELLEAAKYFRDAWNCEWSKLTAKTDDINKHNTAITNAEKQMKP